MGIRDWFTTKVDADSADHSTLADLVVATEIQNAMTAQNDVLKVPAIYRAKTMTEKAIASMPVASWTGTAKSPRQPVIVTNPTAGTREQFLEETVNSLMTGEAYWELSNYVNGFPTDIRVLDPRRMTVTWRQPDQRVREYFYFDTRMRATGFQPNLAVISIDRGPGDLKGFGPMSSDRIDGIVAALDYIQEFFENAGTPTGILRVSKELSKEQADLLKQQWTSRSARTPAVMSSGYEWESLSFNPNDSAWVEAYYATVLDVANLFGIPPTILGFNAPGSALTYQNLSDVYEAWVRTTLRPVYMKPIEAAWSRLVPRGQDVRFDARALTRLSDDQRAEMYTKALSAQTGWLSRDEVRELEGLAPDGVENQVIDREVG